MPAINIILALFTENEQVCFYLFMYIIAANAGVYAIYSICMCYLENDSTVYFLIVLTTDYCWHSWTCRIAALTNFTLID